MASVAQDGYDSGNKKLGLGPPINGIEQAAGLPPTFSGNPFELQLVHAEVVTEWLKTHRGNYQESGAGVGVGILRGSGIPLLENESVSTCLGFLVCWFVGFLVSKFQSFNILNK